MGFKLFYNYFSALKYSERRAFHCRIDAEHNSSPTARLSAADPSQCNVSVEEVGRFFIITSNGLPDHEVHSKKIKSQNIELSIPKVPTIMEVKRFLQKAPLQIISFFSKYPLFENIHFLMNRSNSQ